MDEEKFLPSRNRYDASTACMQGPEVRGCSHVYSGLVCILDAVIDRYVFDSLSCCGEGAHRHHPISLALGRRRHLLPLGHRRRRRDSQVSSNAPNAHSPTHTSCSSCSIWPPLANCEHNERARAATCEYVMIRKGQGRIAVCSSVRPCLSLPPAPVSFYELTNWGRLTDRLTARPTTAADLARSEREGHSLDSLAFLSPEFNFLILRRLSVT